MISIKDHLESETESSNAQILEAIKKRLNEKTNESYEMFENESNLREPTVVNETVVNLETLMTIPKKTTWPKDPPKSDFFSIENAHDETLFMDETIVADASLIAPKIKIKHFDSSELNQIDETIQSHSLSNNDTAPLIEDTNSGETEMKSSFQRMDDSMELDETLNNYKQSLFTGSLEDYRQSLDSDVTIAEPVLKSILSKTNVNSNSTFLGKEKNEKDKPKVNFAPETVDPPSRTLKKNPSAPKYPIIYISSNKSKK